jgi:hypothetical protein
MVQPSGPAWPQLIHWRGAHVDRVATEHLVHLFVDAVRLHRDLLEVRLAQHEALALGAAAGPVGVTRPVAGGLALARHVHEQLQRGLGVRDDAVVGIEHAADLRGLDVHMHELPALGVGLHRTGVAVGPAVADAEHEVAREHGGVAIAVAGLQAHHAGHERVVVGDRAPAHEGGDHRHAGEFGELHQQVGRVGVDDAAAGHDERLGGRGQHVQRLLDLPAVRGGLVDRQGLVGVGVEFDLGHLHVERQVDQHRPRAARAHEVEGLLEHARHQRGLAHRHGPLGDRLGDALDVHRLEVFLVQPGARRLAGDAEDGDAVGLRRVQAGDHVGAGRAAGADAQADVAGARPGVALGHVGGGFHVPRQDVADAAALAHGGVERVDGGAGHTEGLRDAFLLQHTDGGLRRGHSGHDAIPYLG